MSIETPVGSVVNILGSAIDTSREAALRFAISNFGFVALLACVQQVSSSWKLASVNIVLLHQSSLGLLVRVLTF